MKIAIIGSGASAIGVLEGLRSSAVNAEITMFSSDKYFGFSLQDRCGATDSDQFYTHIYRDIKSHATHYPPRKTFYGDTVPCYIVNGDELFFKSDMFGGQTNIWGGFVIPFTEKDFDGWPITREELETHYQAIADLIGIAGQDDQVSDFLQLEYSNRPPLKQLAGFSFLEQYLNKHGSSDSYTFHAGASRSTVDTRDGSPSNCVYCGECMAGCLRDAIYSTKKQLKEHIDKKEIKFVGKNISKIRVRDNKAEVISEGENGELFDKVFLCAGCVATTDILMRSLKMESGPILQDNNVFQFPIINLSRHSDKQKDQYFGLTNLLLLLEPKREDLPLLQVQLYPNVDYLWRTLVPQWAWKLLRYPLQCFRDRIIWARVYMDAADSIHYSVDFINNQLVFKEKNAPDTNKVTIFMESLRQALRGSRYCLLPFKPILAHTSAHMASTFPYGGDLTDVARDGEVMPNVHIADSTCFPRTPVISPTLTIMANARRTAIEALKQ